MTKYAVMVTFNETRDNLVQVNHQSDILDAETIASILKHCEGKIGFEVRKIEDTKSFKFKIKE